MGRASTTDDGHVTKECPQSPGAHFLFCKKGGDALPRRGQWESPGHVHHGTRHKQGPPSRHAHCSGPGCFCEPQGPWAARRAPSSPATSRSHQGGGSAPAAPSCDRGRRPRWEVVDLVQQGHPLWAWPGAGPPPVGAHGSPFRLAQCVTSVPLIKKLASEKLWRKDSSPTSRPVGDLCACPGVGWGWWPDGAAGWV